MLPENNNYIIVRRFTFMYIVISFAFGALIFRLYFIQIHSSNVYKSLQRKQLLKIEKKTFPRGNIYSRNNKLLAVSIPTYSIFADPYIIKNKEHTARLLSEHLGLEYENVISLLNRDRRFIWIKRRVDETLCSIIRKLDLQGIGFRKEYKRSYPYGKLLAHVLGFCGIDDDGLEGVEFKFDDILKSEEELIIIAKDARENPISSLMYPKQKGRKGSNLYLTIDLNIQFILERAIESAFKKWKAKGITGIIMEPYTGDILALANRPTFNPNEFWKYTSSQRRNVAITDPKELGSTMKSFTLASALEEKICRLNDIIYCENGLFRYRGRRLHDHHSYGNLSVEEILVKSSNIGIAKIGLKIGKNILYSYIMDFGFGKKTGIDLPGESGGRVTSYREWSYYTQTSIPMGHEIAVTPLQLIRAYAVFANGGYLVKPRIVRNIYDENSDKMETIETEVIKQVLQPSTANKMTNTLLKVVEFGTGRRAKLKDYYIGGKTGTAQKLNPDGSYSHSKYIASFVCFGPIPNPEVIVIISVDEPKGSYYGGTVAAPVAAKVIEEVFKYLRIPSNKICKRF